MAGLSVATASFGQAAQTMQPVQTQPVQTQPVQAQIAQPASTAEAGSLRRPGDVYKEAMHPLDVVRDSLDNWSDPELAAFATGMRKAKIACEQAKPEDYSGDDLYDLGRLCALGQEWNATHTIAVKYIASGDETHRARAYAMSINALIHMGDSEHGVETAREMLQKLPYDAVVAESVGYLTTYLEESLDPAALSLAVEHRPFLMEALAKGVPLPEIHGNDLTSVGMFYESIMQVAFLQRYAGRDQDADATIADLKAAMAKLGTVGVEDRILITAVDKRYAFLGAQIPSIDVYKSLLNPAAKAKINQVRGSLTVLLLFPDWCAQCHKMMKPLSSLAIRQAESKVYAYGLVFEDGKESSAKAPHDWNFLDANEKELIGTPTLIVSPDTPGVFGADDYPLGVVTDTDGRIRFIGVLPTNALDPHGFVGEVVNRIASGRAILSSGGADSGR
ncbi:hypothetical protein [Acidicapsa ligni]|uniref:hypothetical protein n=1 Tax=Acidicapsa ligni TaxID=542300 RepID=UPI0021E08BD5|nr:hypothetical protein [Acidicapsa ligni]